MTATEVQFRCPVTPRTLFAKFASGEAEVVDGALLKIGCRPCSRSWSRLLGGQAAQIVHEFNLLGEVVGTRLNGKLLTDPTHQGTVAG